MLLSLAMGVFIDMDISAFHPSLSCRLVDYSFPTVDIHSHLSLYKSDDYKKAKELTFKQLYGGVFDKYKNKKFFKKIDIYVKELWSKFESEGETTCMVWSMRDVARI